MASEDATAYPPAGRGRCGGLGFATGCALDCLTWERQAGHALAGQAEQVDESRHECARRGRRSARKARTRRAPVARKRTSRATAWWSA